MTIADAFTCISKQYRRAARIQCVFKRERKRRHVIRLFLSEKGKLPQVLTCCPHMGVEHHNDQPKPSVDTACGLAMWTLPSSTRYLKECAPLVETLLPCRGTVPCQKVQVLWSLRILRRVVAARDFCEALLTVHPICRRHAHAYVCQTKRSKSEFELTNKRQQLYGIRLVVGFIRGCFHLLPSATEPSSK